MLSLYLIGSLRNPDIPTLGNEIRELGFEVFDDWHAAGPHADDEWKRYETERGHTYVEALKGYAARHVFSFDKFHLDRCDGAILVMPAGKSGHLELGYMAGKGKPTFVLLEEGVDRWDVMYQFCNGVALNKEELCHQLCTWQDQSLISKSPTLESGELKQFNDSGHMVYVPSLRSVQSR